MTKSIHTHTATLTSGRLYTLMLPGGKNAIRFERDIPVPISDDVAQYLKENATKEVFVTDPDGQSEFLREECLFKIEEIGLASGRMHV